MEVHSLIVDFTVGMKVAADVRDRKVFVNACDTAFRHCPIVRSGFVIGSDYRMGTSAYCLSGQSEVRQLFWLSVPD